MSLEKTVYPSPEINSSSFDISNYLEERSEKTNFLIVEIGHREKPIAPHQENLHWPGRAYIGIEANLRDPINIVRPKIADMQKSARANNKNIFFIDHDLGGDAFYQDGDADSQPRPSKMFSGDYEPTTALPEEVADEVFLGNVFGDPHVSYSRENTERLLGEVTRLLLPGGKVIIRETITPEYSWNLSKSLEKSSLHETAHIEPNAPEWNEMEEVFNGAQDSFRNPGSFYVILEKPK